MDLDKPQRPVPMKERLLIMGILIPTFCMGLYLNRDACLLCAVALGHGYKLYHGFKSGFAAANPAKP